MCLTLPFGLPYGWGRERGARFVESDYSSRHREAAKYVAKLLSESFPPARSILGASQA